MLSDDYTSPLLIGLNDKKIPIDSAAGGERGHNGAV